MKSFLFIALMGISILLSSCSTGYVKRDGKVYYEYWNEGSGQNCDELTEADYDSFEKLKGGFARDAHYAWFCGDIIDGADGATFRALDSWYAADDNAVFFCGEIVERADPNTFRPITYYYAEDARDYYWNGRPLYVADKASFKIVGDPDEFDTQWGIDKLYVYLLEGYHSDADSDRVRVADYESFHALDNQYAMLNNYAADKYQVYFGGAVVEGADPETFHEVEFRVGQDKNRVYYGAQPTSVADFSKLVSVGSNYVDEQHVYARNFDIVEGADPASYHVIVNPWTADKDHVFWNDRIVEGADPLTFKSDMVYSYGLDEPRDSWDYGRDKNHVYYHDTVYEDADPATFTIIDAPDAEGWTVFDKNNYYDGCETEYIRNFRKSHNID